MRIEPSERYKYLRVGEQGQVILICEKVGRFRWLKTVLILAYNSICKSLSGLMYTVLTPREACTMIGAHELAEAETSEIWRMKRFSI